jgi:hypothetical protein
MHTPQSTQPSGLIFALPLSMLIALLGHSSTQDSQPVHFPLSTSAGIQYPFQRTTTTIDSGKRGMILDHPAISSEKLQIHTQCGPRAPAVSTTQSPRRNAAADAAGTVSRPPHLAGSTVRGRPAGILPAQQLRITRARRRRRGDVTSHIPSDNVYEKSLPRGMGILPMSRRAILALPTAGGFHGRDARGTHGQDARATFHTRSERQSVRNPFLHSVRPDGTEVLVPSGSFQRHEVRAIAAQTGVCNVPQEPVEGAYGNALRLHCKPAGCRPAATAGRPDFRVAAMPRTRSLLSFWANHSSTLWKSSPDSPASRYMAIRRTGHLG